MPYTIEARSLDIMGVASHDFWVLRDGSGKALAELHGLATDRRSGQAVPIGTDEDRHSLRVWHYAHDEATAARTGSPVSRTSYIEDGQRHRAVLVGPENEVLARWNAAVAAKAPLNALDLDYPNFGFRMDGSTVNSNSAYRTLGEIMGVAVRDFPGVLEPGIENRMTSPARIYEMRVKGFPVLDAPSRREGERYASLPDGGLAPPPLPQPGLLGQATDVVRRLDATVGRVPDETSDRLAFNLASLAKRAGFVRIDHAVLSVATDRGPAGENVFVVQGELTAPTNRVAHMRSADAVNLPTQDALAQLHETVAPTHAVEAHRRQAENEQLGPRLVRT